MNIFYIEIDPVKAAQALCNKHISRMPLESLGMLAYAFPEGEAPYPNKRDSHYNHPASKWARESLENFEWLLAHAIAQCVEYTARYKREHYSQQYISQIEDMERPVFPTKGLTPFARCFGTWKEVINPMVHDTLEAYRSFYMADKETFAKWPSINMIPAWWNFEPKEKYVDKNFINGNYIKR